MDHHYLDSNIAAADGALYRVSRFQWLRGHVVNQYDFIVAHDGDRRFPASASLRGSHAMLIRAIMADHYHNYHAATDGAGVGWNTDFQLLEFAPIFIDEASTRSHAILIRRIMVVDGTGVGWSTDFQRGAVRVPEYQLPADEGGLSEEVIAKKLKIKTCDHATINDQDKQKICVVCQDNIDTEIETIGVLRCGHEYHASCIKTWLHQKNICPLCKAIAL